MLDESGHAARSPSNDQFTDRINLIVWKRNRDFGGRHTRHPRVGGIPGEGLALNGVSPAGRLNPSHVHGFSGLTMVPGPEEANPIASSRKQHITNLPPVGVDELHHANAVVQHRFRLWQNRRHRSRHLRHVLSRARPGTSPTKLPKWSPPCAAPLTVVQHKDELDRLHRYEVRLHRQEIKDMPAFRCFQANRIDQENRAVPHGHRPDAPG